MQRLILFLSNFQNICHVQNENVCERKIQRQRYEIKKDSKRLECCDIKSNVVENSQNNKQRSLTRNLNRTFCQKNKKKNSKYRR